MLRRAFLLILVPFLVAPAAAEARGVFVDGDSLAVGTRPYLEDELPAWTVRTSATVSRHADEGAAVLRAAGRLPKVIAVSLGTNDDPRSVAAFESAIESLVGAAGGRCVVWATIRRPPVAGAGYRGYNEVLRRAGARARRLQARAVEEAGRAAPRMARRRRCPRERGGLPGARGGLRGADPRLPPR